VRARATQKLVSEDLTGRVEDGLPGDTPSVLGIDNWIG
jgi:hypothetical protein